MEETMKSIVVIYSGDDWSVEVPINYELTRKAFERWHSMALEKGVAMYRASIHWYDKEGGFFRKAWAFRDREWRKVERPIIPDMVYDKTPGGHERALYDLKMAIGMKSKMFNSPLFRTMVDNKLSQYALFSEHMPLSFVASNASELEESMGMVPTEKVVVKPLQGSGGYGIVIGTREEIVETELEFPVLVQEFIRNSSGIPGFSNPGELADLRVVFMNHEPMYALSRIARPGSLLTNLHQGAVSVRVPLEAVPQSAWDIAEKVIGKLRVFPQAQYSLDFFFSEDGKAYLIEMNTVPGLCLIEAMEDEQLRQKDFEAFIALVPGK